MHDEQEVPAPVAPPPLPVIDTVWQKAPPHPWRRWIARMIDLYTIGLASYIVLLIPVFIASSDVKHTEEITSNQIIAGMGCLLSGIPLLATLVGLTSTSLGKWVLGIRVVGADGKPIGFARALRREAHVIFAGYGLGIPLVSLITLVYSYNTLVRDGVMPWDTRAGATVQYHAWTPGQILKATFGIAAALILVGTLVTLGGKAE